MKVRFWGTRGSIPKPGPKTLKYGGNTSCVEVRSSSGTLVVIDCGSGSHDLGQSLMAQANGPIQGTILISHTHWDHIQGFPFFAPLFVSGNEWNIYAPRGLNSSLEDTLSGQMQYTYFPITLDVMGADIHYHELVEGEFSIGDIRVRTHYLNHPALTLGYRLEVDGSSVVYVCDNEPYCADTCFESGNLSAQEQAMLEFLRNADLVIHDAQYTAKELKEKTGWGHSSGEYAASICKAAGVKQLALTHHDPTREDEAVDRIVNELQSHFQTNLTIFGAAEGTEIELEHQSSGSKSTPAGTIPTEKKKETALLNHSLLLFLKDQDSFKMIEHIATEEEIFHTHTSDAKSFLSHLQDADTTVLLLEDDEDQGEFTQILKEMTGSESIHLPASPLIVLSNKPEPSLDLSGLKVDWLQRPVSSEYLRARIHACILRTTCKWIRAHLPTNEEARMEALCSLNILDTPEEPRFDKITEEAARIFDVPIAVVSLVDSDRQWFKSICGMDARETSRDASFCAHAIHDDEVFVVPDTLMDPRFAENILVTSGPRIRFYAGAPLQVGNGLKIGTLCLIDTKPREMKQKDLELLGKLAKRVEEQVLLNK